MVWRPNDAVICPNDEVVIVTNENLEYMAILEEMARKEYILDWVYESPHFERELLDDLSSLNDSCLGALVPYVHQPCSDGTDDTTPVASPLSYSTQSLSPKPDLTITHMNQLRECIDRALIWKPRFSNGKVDMALRTYVTRRAENYLRKVDPDCTLQLAKKAEGIIEAAWQEDDTLKHSRTRDRKTMKKILEASTYQGIPLEGWLRSKTNSGLFRKIRNELRYRKACFSSWGHA
jgi:hypothetical protein